MPRVTWYLGRWIRSTDWYPDYQLRLYDRRGGEWNGRRVHESVTLDGRAGPAARRAPALRLPRHLRSSRHDRSLHDAGGASRCAAEGRRAVAGRLVGHPPFAFLRNYVAARRLPRRRAPGLIVSVAQLVLRVPEAREAVGASDGRARGSTVPVPHSGSRVPTPITLTCSRIHIDTARTWRGGQNQVLLTVLGLRALGHRTMLVAHPAGELRQRAEEGLELIPLAPKTEMDLTAAWRLSRLIKQLQPDVDPRARSARRRHGGAGAVDEHAARPSRALVAARRVDFHLKGNALSRWKYRQVDCFICASEAIRHDAVCRRRPGRARGHGARGHRPGRTSRRRRPRSCTRSSGCRTTRRSSATSPRWCRTRASGT